MGRGIGGECFWSGEEYTRTFRTAIYSAAFFQTKLFSMRKHLFLLIYLLLFLLQFGCKKEEPSLSLPLNKTITSEVSSDGLSALYEYQESDCIFASWSKIIKKISTSDGWEVVFIQEDPGITVHFENGGNVFNQTYYTPNCGAFVTYCDQDIPSVHTDFEYGNGGHLTKKVTTVSGDETTDIFIWEEENLISSTTHELGQEVLREYEYYLGRINTVYSGRFDAKIIRSEGGVITSYDGDRIMAVYIGDYKNTSAARTALKINFAVSQIINPAIEHQYPKDTYRVKQVVGIDTSSLYVARTGIRGSNDLVWVGRAANYAAKLTSLSAEYPSWITSDVYSKMADAAKFSSDGRDMWEKVTWTSMGNMTIYRSTWWWSV